MLDHLTRSLLRSITLALGALLTVTSTLAAQTTPTVSWDANTESNLAGYVIQYGTNSSSPSNNLDVGNVTSRQVSGLQAGQTYYFRVVAYNTSGQTSAPSSQVSYSVPATSTLTLTSVSPTSGPTTGGTVITLTGTSFVSGATVRVGGVAATGVTFVSATQVRATTPAGTAGTQGVQIINPNGQSATLYGAFTYTTTSAPTLSSVSPTSGPTSGGTIITLTGTNFVSGATVRVGSTAATGVTFVSATQVRATTPAGTAGAQAVQITNPNGQSATLAGGFTYTSSLAPSLSSVSPTSGPTTGGTVITLTGTNFVSGATVRVGGTAATGVTFVSATQVRATTPAGTAGNQTVQITNPNGQSDSRNNAFTYVTAAAPSLSSVSPTSGPTSGGTVITLTGSNFVSGATVRVGGANATGVTFVSATQVRATTPAGTAGAQTVQIVNPDGQSASRGSAFTYTTTTAAPTLSSVSPTSGPTAGGTVITLTGTNFASGATVRVGATSAPSVTFVSATQLRATTPAGAAGAQTVVVSNPNGQSVSLASAFTYTTSSSTTLTFTSISPTSGPTSGGQTVTLSGTNFKAGGNLYINLGGEPLTNVVVVSSTQITGRTPARDAGVKTIRFTNGDGQFLQINNAYTYTTTSTATAAATELMSASADVSSLDAASTEGLRLDDTVDESALTFKRYLAEGAVTEDMTTRLAIANPQSVNAHVRLTFTDSIGKATRQSLVVPARTRRTVDLSEIPELAGASFSTLLESDQPVGLDRLVSWDKRGLATSLEAAIEQPSTRWYFAEGSTTNPFELFYLLQNPGSEAAEVQVRYLLPDGVAPVTKSYTVAAGSRATIWVDRQDPALAATEVAAEITSVNGAPIVVERTLYVAEAGTGRPRGGDTSAGVTAPSTSWVLEGATGDYAMFLLFANPNDAPAVATATYVREDGGRVVKSYTLAPNSRRTVNVAAEDASLARTALAVHVDTTGAPIVVERTQWWGTDGQWDDAVSGAGATESASRWILAEAEQGGARQATTSLVVLNNAAAAVKVTVTLLFEDGPEASATFDVAGNGQFEVPVARAFPSAEGRRFSIVVEAADPAASLVVDRTLYWHGDGSARTAGADAAAAPLR